MPDYKDILSKHANNNKNNSNTDTNIEGLNEDNTTKNENNFEDINSLNDILKSKSQDKTSLRQGYQTDVGISEYEPYLPGFNPTIQTKELDYARATNQSNWEKTFNMGKQMLGEIVGGAISGIGSIAELPSALIDELSGESADFNNFLIEFGEGIKEYAKENGQIYRTNPNKAFDFSDFGWWTQNGVSLASTIGLMIPATGTIKGIGLIGDILKISDKVGDATKYWSKLSGSALIMRNAENMTESLSVANNSRNHSLKIFEDEEKYEQIANGELGEELKANGQLVTKENLANLIAAKAGWRSYQVNSANIVFDMVQMAPLFKGFKAGTRTNKNISKKVEETIKGHGFDSFGKVTRVKKVKRFFNPVLNPIARQSTEGIEEGINFIGGAEGEYYGKTLAGGKETNFGDRLSEYLTDGHFYESAAWGVAGGVAFDGATGLLRRTQGYKDTTDDNKIKEIEQRQKVISDYKKANEDIINDTDLTPNQKKEYIAQLQDEMAMDLAMRASAVGNIDILLDNINHQGFKEHLIKTGLADATDVDSKIERLNNTILKTEKSYNNYYNKFFVGNQSQDVKNYLITESIKNEQAIDRLTSQNEVMKGLINTKKSKDIHYQNNLENGINEALEIKALEESINLLKGTELSNRVPNLERKLNETKEKYKGTLKFDPTNTDFLNKVNPEIIENQVEQNILEEALESHSERLIELSDINYRNKLNDQYLKDIEEEKQKIKEEKKKEKENKEKETIIQKAKKAKNKIVNKVKNKKEENPSETKEETKEEAKEKVDTTPQKEFSYPNDPNIYNGSEFKNDAQFQKALSEPKAIDNWLMLYNPDDIYTREEDREQNTKKYKALQNYKAELDNNIQNSIFNKKEETDNSFELERQKEEDTAIEVYSQENETFYTEENNKNVQEEQNEVDSSLETFVDIVNVEEGAKIKREEGDERVINGYNILAYLSRGYENIIKIANDGTETLTKEDINNSLNSDLLDKNILNPNEYQIGDELTIAVDNEYYKENEDGSTTTFSSLQANEETKNSLIPIAIYKDGKKVAYLHDVNWINETNVAGDVQQQKEKLQQIRDFIAKQKEPVTIKITNRNYGKLARTKDNRQIDTINAFPDKNLKFGIGKNGKLHKNREEETNEVLLNKQFNEGAIYAVAQIGTKDGKKQHIGLPLQRKKVPTHISKSITKAVKLYLENNKESKEVNDIYENYGYNILTTAGLKNYINNFINVYELDSSINLQDKLKGLTSDVHLLTVTTNSIDFGRGKGIGFKSLSRETPLNIQEQILENLEKHLEDVFVDFDMDKLNSGETKIPLLNDTENIAELSYENYNDFIKSFTTTNLLSFDLGNGNFAYTIQPVIETNVSDLVNENLVESEKTFNLDNKELNTIEDYNFDSFINYIEKSVKIEFTKLPKGKFGGFFIGTNEIIISDELPGDEIIPTVAHEYIHYLADNNDNQKELHKELKSFFNEIKGDLRKTNLNSKLIREMLTKPEEFLTYGLTDIDVLKELNKIEYKGNIEKYKGKSIFDIIIKLISDFVIKDNTAAKKLLEIAKKYEYLQQQIISNKIEEQIDDTLDEDDMLGDDFSPSIESKSNINYKNIQKEIEESVLIKGFTASKQDVIISAIAYDINKQVIDNGKLKQSEVFNNWLIYFKEQREKYNKAGKTRVVAEFDKIINNFDKVKLFTLKKVGKINGIKIKDNVTVDGLQDVETYFEKTNFNDEATLQLDSKDTVSFKLKRFFSGIYKIDSNGNIEKPYMGLKTYVPFDTIYNEVSAILANSSADYSSMIKILENYVDAKPYLSSLINKLQNADEQTKNEFVVSMSKHKVNMVYLLWTKDRKTGTYSMIAKNSNQNDLSSSILNSWTEGLKSSTLTTINENNDLILNDNIDNIIQELENFETTEPTIEQLGDFLKSIGIEMNPKSLTELKEKGLRSKGKRLKYNQLFKVSNGIFKILKENLKESKKTNIVDSNPFRSTVFKSLAILEAKYNTKEFSNSFKNGEGNTIYSFSNNKYFIDRVRELKENKELLNDLQSLSFNGNSLWLEQLNSNENNLFKREFDYFYLDSLIELGSGKKGKKLSAMSDAEHEITKLGLFWNKGVKVKEKGEEKRIVKMFYPTMSDKTTMVGFNTIAQKVKLSLNGDISKDTINLIYDYVVLPELKRAINFKLNNRKTGIKGYQDGANMIFSIPELNNNEQLFTNGIINETALAKKEVLDSIKSDIKNHLNTLVENKLKYWKEVGINETTFIDEDYKNYALSQSSKEDLMKYSALDYIANTLITNQNAFQLLIGDPALFYKSKSKDNIQKVKDTFENIGKRMASQIAPGQDLADSENDSYVQGFIKDYESASKYLDAYSKYLSEKDLKDYKGIEGTDAQEFTTVAEHLYVMQKLGKLTDKQVKSIQNKALKGTLSEEEIGLIFQPMKPVYVGQYMDKGNDVQRMMYIKSSSFPLVPQLTKGLEIDKLRKAMEHPENGVDRVSFSTANKVGDFIKPTKVFDDNGNIIDNLEITTKLKLKRNGFRIQQEVPYKESKDKINDGSQQRKLLFANILNVPGVRKIKERYDEIYHELYKKDYEDLIDELDIKPDGSFNRLKLHEILLKEAEDRNYSINDIQSLKIDKNSKFIYPLAFNNSASKFEALLTSIVDNRVRKKKFRGNSFVLGTEEGFKTSNSIKESGVDKSSIVFTDNWTGELKPQRPETVETKILYTKDTISEGVTHINSLQADEKYKLNEEEKNILFDFEQGVKNTQKVLDLLNSKLKDKLKTKKETVIKPAQILVPFKFRDNNGKLLNAKDYISKFDDKILESFGFRIPTQGLNSMSPMEVVGFLPQSAGDLLIAPREFTIQMGSDFDVDKLYSNMYNTVQYNGVLRIINNDLINEIKSDFEVESIDELKEEFNKEELKELINKYNSIIDEIQDDIKSNKELENKFGVRLSETRDLFNELKKQKDLKSTVYQDLETLKLINDVINDKYRLQNELLDIHLEILKNPAKEIQSQILEPLGFGTLKDDAKLIDSYTKKEEIFSPLSDSYQKMKFINATAGKAGVGVFSMDSVFNALLQDKNIELLNEEGKPFKVKFGNYVSNKLSDVHALKGENEEVRYKSQVIAAYQSAAVDNEKEQILDKLNINSHTFDVIATLNQLGFRENVVTAFINQPIIRDYVLETIKASDITSEVTSNIEDYVYNKLKEKYKSNIYKPELHSTLADKNVKDMLDNIKNYTNTISNNNIQLAVLDKFLTLNEKGKKLKEVKSAINSDSAGIDSSLIETQSKQESIYKLFTSKDFSNLGSLIGEYSKEPKEGYIPFYDIYIKPTTINGNVAVYGIRLNNLLWSNEFHYHKKILTAPQNGIFNTIIRITGKSDKTVTQKNQIKKEIWNNIKSYLFTSQSSNLYDKDIKQLREELLFDTKDNKSLATEIRELRNHPVGIKNAFINKLSTDIQKGQKPSLVTFNASTGENFDETNIYAAFVELLVNDRKVNETSTREIAEKLIKYQFITGGLQQAKQFIKYIPVSYLNEIGFSSYLNNAINELNNNFVRQYVQNNPGKVPRITREDLGYKKDNKQDIDKIDFDDTIINPKYLDNKGLALPYISMYNKKSESGYDLYELNGKGSYIKINTLGSKDFKEYDLSTDYLESTIKSNEGIRKLNRPTIQKKEVKINEPLQNYGIDKSIDTKQRTINFLNNVIKKSNNKLYVALATKMKNNISKIDVQILLDENLNADGKHNNGIITINPNRVNTQKNVEKVILHELIHAFTKKGLQGNTRSALRIKGLFNEFKDSLPQDKLNIVLELLNKIKKGENVKLKLDGLSIEEIKTIYAGVSVDEFVAVLFESKELQNILQETNFSKNKNFLEELIDRIVKLLEDLGFKGKSDLTLAIQDVFNLIDNIEQFEKSNEQFSPTIESVYNLELRLGTMTNTGKTKYYNETDVNYINKLEKEYKDRLPKGFEIKKHKKDNQIGFYVQPVEEEYSPTSDENKGRYGKFGKLIRETESRIKNIKNNITRAKSEKDLQKVILLEERLLEVEEDLTKLQDALKLEDIQYYAEKDLSRIKEILDNEDSSYFELEEAQRLIHTWQKGIDLFFTPDEKTSEILVDEFSKYRIQADLYNDKLVNKQKSLARKLVSKLTGKDITIEDMFKEFKDVNGITSQVLDISHTDNLLLQSVWKAVKLANNEARLETDKIAKNIDKLINDASSYIGKGKEKFSIFKQLTKNGEWTGDLVHRFSKQYFDERAIKYNKAKRINTKASWETYYKWRKENELIFDVRKLFPDETLYKSKFNEEVKNKHIKELKNTLGEKGYNYFYSQLERKINEFKDLKEVQKELIELKDLSKKEKDLLLEEWEKQNSPYYASEVFGTGKSLKVGDKYVNPKGFEFTFVVPKKVENNKWYDSNFEQIESNESLYNLYNYIIDTLGQMTTIVPDNQKQRIRENTLPEIKKSIINMFSEEGIKGGLGAWYNKLIEDISVNELSDTTYSEIDPITGEESKKLKVGHIVDNSQKQKELRKRAEIEFELNNNRKPNREEKEQIRDDIYKALLKEKSFDLGVILKAYSAAVLSYKHKSIVEPQLKLANSILNNIEETKFNAQGVKMKTPDNKLAKKSIEESYVNTKKMYDFYFSSFYGSAKKLEGVGKDKKYTPKEKEEKKKIEELIAKNEENKESKDYNKIKEELQAQLDNIGTNRAWSKRGDKILQYVQLKGMSYNVLSGFANMMFGFVDNITTGSDGRLYTNKEYYKGLGMTLKSVGRSTKEANKISNLMQQLDVLKDASNELFESSNKSVLQKRMKFLAPYEVQKKTEYINQAPVMIAMLNSEKVKDKDITLWEALDENGNIKEDSGLTKEQLDNFKVKLDQIIKMNHGNYDTDSAIMGKQTITGRALMQFRTWMFESFNKRFGAEKFDSNLDITRKGRYRTLWDTKDTIWNNKLFLTQMLFKKLTVNKTFKDLKFEDRFNEVDAANMRANFTELVTYMSLMGMLMLLKMSKDDEEDKNLFMTNMLINQMLRLQTDMEFYINPSAFETLTKNSIPAMSLVTDISQWFSSAGKLIIGEDEITSGVNSGDSRFLRETSQMLPLGTQVYRVYNSGKQIFDK